MNCGEELSTPELLGTARPCVQGPQAGEVSSVGAASAHNTGSASVEAPGNRHALPPVLTPPSVIALGWAPDNTGVAVPAPADPVNRPRHYTQHASGIECIDISEWLSGNLEQALQYVWRHLHKGRPDEDLAKAQWYLRREIGRRAQISGTFMPTSDPGLFERWGRVITAEPCGRTAIVYRSLRLAHFGPVFDVDSLQCAHDMIGAMRAAL